MPRGKNIERKTDTSSDGADGLTGRVVMAKGRESGMPDEPYWGTFFNPACIVERLDCGGRNAVEFGCGYGTFTIPAAKRVTGKVIALDIEPEMVVVTARKAAEAGLANVLAEAGISRPRVAGGRMRALTTRCCSTSCTSKTRSGCCVRRFAHSHPAVVPESSTGSLILPPPVGHRWKFGRPRNSAGSGLKKRASGLSGTKIFAAVRGTGEW